MKMTTKSQRMRIKNSLPTILILVLAFLLAPPAALAVPSDQSDVRAAVQHIFDQLKNGQYESLYDALPASARTRLSRERLVQGLQRTQNLYQLQRIEIGTVSVSGTLAVVDTTMFAHIAKPLDGDGKLEGQQYLIREDGKWKVATGAPETINRFLKSNPSFARRFPIKKPRALINQNGNWIEIPLGKRN